LFTTRKIEYSDSQLVSLEIEPPPLLLLPTVIAAFPTATAHKQLPTCNQRRLWVYLWRFHFPSLLFSVTNSLIRTTSSPPQPIVFNKEWAKSISGHEIFQFPSFNFRCFQFHHRIT
jgi:hypothetical protein